MKIAIRNGGRTMAIHYFDACEEYRKTLVDFAFSRWHSTRERFSPVQSGF